MLEIGKMNNLTVTRKTQNGVHLNSKGQKSIEEVFLPQKQLQQDIKVGDDIEVFVYRNAEDRLIASTKKPKLTLGEIGVLQVVDITQFGAFLDWGLEKDLLLPSKEQIGEVTKGSSYLVGLFINASNRLCATMKIYDLLKTESPYKENDKAHGTVYNFNPEYGVFVAVDNKYHGLIPTTEQYGNFVIGDNIEVRIKKIRQDGKLVLSVRQEAYTEIEKDARRILEKLKTKGGALKVNDDSPPELIKAQFNISKRAFKRAVGRLLKEGAIELTDDGIKMRW